MADLLLSEETARRTRFFKEGNFGSGPVLYWMSRDQRAEDNWALLAAREAAALLGKPLRVLFCFAPDFSGAASRHYRFLLEGLRNLSDRLAEKNIPLDIFSGPPGSTAATLAHTLDAAVLFSDFDPYPEKRPWKQDLLERISCPAAETDAHNIIPGWTASSKKEFSAATFRRKVSSLLPLWLTQFPELDPMPPANMVSFHPVPLPADIPAFREAPAAGPSLEWITPGEISASAGLRKFIDRRLAAYADKRNDPASDGVSELSPWLHFGHLSAQRAALEVSLAADSESAAAFLEELVVRRELADNFCFREKAAGTFAGLPDWARQSLAQHREDPRPVLYPDDVLESATTDDPLWNAAQKEMILKGKMHGWARMYWAKKLLEWSQAPEAAFALALRLNDRYELDGRDPCGITGVSWAIGGLHDRPWPERPIFGKIRYMNYAGALRKFNVKQYVQKIEALENA